MYIIIHKSYYFQKVFLSTQLLQLQLHRCLFHSHLALRKMVHTMDDNKIDLLCIKLAGTLNKEGFLASNTAIVSWVIGLNIVLYNLIGCTLNEEFYVSKLSILEMQRTNYIS